MAKEQTATFIGHKECYGVSSEQVREEIIKLIENGVTDFLSGGMGSFDWMCARIVFELKKTYPHIHNYLVIPYNAPPSIFLKTKVTLPFALILFKFS